MRQPPRLTTTFGIVLVFCTLLTSTILIGACAAAQPRPFDTSQISAQQLIQVVRGINDVTKAAIETNRAGRLSDSLTAQLLTINQQILDVVEASPQDFKTRVIATLDDRRAKLSAGDAILLAPYLAADRAVLDGAPVRMPATVANTPALER